MFIQVTSARESKQLRLSFFFLSYTLKGNQCYKLCLVFFVGACCS